MLLNNLRILASIILKMFLNVISSLIGRAVIIFHCYKPTGSTDTFFYFTAMLGDKKEI